MRDRRGKGSARRPAKLPEPAAESAEPIVAELTIERLGHLGDGIAAGPDGPIHVAGALPGERVRAEGHGKRWRVAEILSPSPDRIEPACRHFHRCGGCSLQHLADAPYRSFKHDAVVTALAARGITVPVAPLIAAAAPGGRRRVTLGARRGPEGVSLGYHVRDSHEVVAIEECPIAAPAIVAALPQLRALAGKLVAARDPLRLTVTAAPGGLDVDAEGAGPIDEARRRSLSAFALKAGFLRLSLAGDVVVAAAPVEIEIGEDVVAPPPGGFLQASAAAAAAMTAEVVAAVTGARRIADLFAGVGTFSLPLARTGAAVLAVEGAPAAVAALDAARRRAGLSRLTPERRDLFQRPLLAAELAACDAVVFDPPFAGAAAQATTLAGSKVATVVAVSCNPATLARDLATLVAGGYQVERVVPIDQFLWSSHVEVVAVLRRPSARRH